MNTTADMLTHYTRAGAYAASTEQLLAINKAAIAVGFDCWSLEIGTTQTAPSLLRHIGQALHFPEWYGENWDALADCLTDLSWSDADGFVMLLRGSDVLRAAQPALWQTLMDMLGEVSDFWRNNQIAFWVLVDGAVDTLPAFPQIADMPDGVFKKPESVLVLIHTPALEVLLIERALHRGFWQSVTGSLEEGELPRETACRELAEETGIIVTADALCDWQLSNRFKIFGQWRHRYAPGVTHNIEHVFSLEVPLTREVRLAPQEHVDAVWLPWREAAAKCFSWSNRDAILMLPLQQSSAAQ